MRNENGFTLIEMMIVLLIISVLVLIAIPNVTKHSRSIDEKGCDAYVKMVQGQVEAYKMDHKEIPTLESLQEKKYVAENPQCPDGRSLTISADGEVIPEPLPGQARAVDAE
ncbi:competence protein ComGC [Sporosarcina luteola]|nr:competence protein ComGC [Sporosarcina luteola]